MFDSAQKVNWKSKGGLSFGKMCYKTNLSFFFHISSSSMCLSAQLIIGGRNCKNLLKVILKMNWRLTFLAFNFETCFCKLFYLITVFKKIFHFQISIAQNIDAFSCEN